MTVPKMQMPHSVPLIGKQKELQEQQKQLQIQAAMETLARTIYTQLALRHLADESLRTTVEVLSGLARDAQTAARCYFEGIQENKE